MIRFGFCLVAFICGYSECLQAQDFRAFRDQNGDAYVEWDADEGYSYILQSSDDLEFWSTDSTWTGFGQTVSVLVQEASNGGGGGGAIPGNPRYDFLITDYPNGDSLISWKGLDGNPYQLYTTDTYFQVGDPPLFDTTITDPVQDYDLFLIRTGYPLPPNAASLTLAALPQSEQDQVTQLTSQHAQVVADIAANGGTNTQTGAVSANVGDAGFFRLLVFREDSDGDGLYNEIEQSFGTNPYDPDTDQDGVTDPWDHANIGHVIISEFMASNEGVVRDQFGEFKDYIELFNPTASTVDLSGYYLTCDPNNLDEWQIPAGVSLAPGESILIFASKNDLVNPAQPLHTNFKLSSQGEDILLVAPDAVTVIDSHLNWGPQRTNASAGWGLDRETGLVSSLRYFFDPTPGTLNSFDSCLGFSSAPVIIGSPGIFTATTKTVTMTSDPGSVIHYTLDGSNPTSDSPVYTSALQIDSTTIVRAIAVQPGCVPSSIVARSYLFKEDVIGTGGQGNPAVDYQIRPTNYPAAAIRNGVPIQLFNPNRPGLIDYEMSSSVVEDHYNTIFDDLTEIPTLSVSLPTDQLFGSTNGIYSRSDDTTNDGNDPMDNDWRRVASFEYIDPANPADYAQETGELTISGASSRRFTATNKHNMRLLFKPKFTLMGDAFMRFKDSPFTGTEEVDFVQLQLRNPTHDSWGLKWGADEPNRSVSVREAWARSVHEAMNPTENWIAHRRWVHLYLNGLYWGIYELTERIDENFARSYGDAFADYDVVKQLNGVVDGDMVEYTNLRNRCIAARDDPNNAAKWSLVEDMLDCDNYIDYLLINMFVANSDWPGNNWRAIRRREAGAKFKFLIWDAERACNPSSLNSNRTGVSGGAAEFHNYLIAHPQYKEAFKDRCDIHFGAGGQFALTAGVHAAKQSFQSAMDDYSGTIYSESARWGDSRADNAPNAYTYTFDDPNYLPGQTDRGDWKRTSEYHRDVWMTQRRQIMLNHLKAPTRDLARSTLN